MIASVAVVGAGAWGTAMAAHLARRADLRVVLWARDDEQARAIAASRVNNQYLNDVVLPAALEVTSDATAMRGVQLLMFATPSAALLDVARHLRATGAQA